ncbi:UNVERIFIED_CONTAM: hypothetical protein Sradi_7086900, partial [Sesamum radiatum]
TFTEFGIPPTICKHLISEEEATQITAPVQRHEIKDALFDINEDSAPGPDGFSSSFFKATWAVIGEDVCRAIMEFFNHGRLLKQLNATLLTFIPKVQLPTKKKLPPRCTIKVDLQKAYDMVDWDYLLAVLRLFRFPNRFIVWVEQCITTASFSISLNGTIHGFFTSTRGLRQGDPISPYLFVLVMESLHLLIKHKIQNDGNFQHHWRCKELGIINLCFADDLLLFCKADIHSATVLHDILQNFGVLSGLHANAQKSQVLFSKSATQVQHQIQSIFGFPQGTLPVRYLGVPLITSKLSLADCAPLILKIEARIAGWNQLKLTYAGRTQLIKSV